MFNIKNGMISLNKTKVLSPKQLYNIKKMSEHDQTRYMLSILGLLKTNHVRVPRLKSYNTDTLKDKREQSIFKQFKILQDLGLDHRPSTKNLGQWIGVEIECIIPHQDGDGSGGDCECEYDDNEECTYTCDSCSRGPVWSEREAHRWLSTQLTKAGVTRCNVKHDGSLSDDDGHGIEVTILFNTAYGFEPLHRLCKALLKARCYVNKTCGLHVHLDARNLKQKQVKLIGKSLGHALPVLKWLVPESRHDNQYCRLAVSALRGERYYAVNLTAFRVHKTIEVRLHSGSINADKIIQWFTLLKLIGAARLKHDITTFQDLIDIPGMSESLVEYMDSRITELNPEAWPKLIPIEPPPRDTATPIVPVNITADQFDALVFQPATDTRQGA